MNGETLRRLTTFAVTCFWEGAAQFCPARKERSCCSPLRISENFVKGFTGLLCPIPCSGPARELVQVASAMRGMHQH